MPLCRIRLRRAGGVQARGGRSGAPVKKAKHGDRGASGSAALSAAAMNTGGCAIGAATDAQAADGVHLPADDFEEPMSPANESQPGVAA